MEPDKPDSADARDRIVETFAGRKILLTGGTGFLGKVILEKFLRCLPEIAQIYMFIRLKKGKDPKQRLLEILNSPVSFSQSDSFLIKWQDCHLVSLHFLKYAKRTIKKFLQNNCMAKCEKRRACVSVGYIVHYSERIYFFFFFCENSWRIRGIRWLHCSDQTSIAEKVSALMPQ